MTANNMAYHSLMKMTRLICGMKQKDKQPPLLDHVDSWLGGLAVIALDLRPDGRKFDFWLPQLVLGWVTIFGWANYLSISPSHPARLSLLALAGWEMSTSQSVVMLCGSEIKAGMAHSTCG